MISVSYKPRTQSPWRTNYRPFERGDFQRFFFFLSTAGWSRRETPERLNRVASEPNVFCAVSREKIQGPLFSIPTDD